MRAPLQREQWTHDLKNQLGIVLGFSELLLEGFDSADPRRADAQEIQTAARRALHLLTDDSTLSEGDRP